VRAPPDAHEPCAAYQHQMQQPALRVKARSDHRGWQSPSALPTGSRPLRITPTCPATEAPMLAPQPTSRLEVDAIRPPEQCPSPSTVPTQPQSPEPVDASSRHTMGRKARTRITLSAGSTVHHAHEAETRPSTGILPTHAEVAHPASHASLHPRDDAALPEDVAALPQ
jgi:hypothetical protein